MSKKVIYHLHDDTSNCDGYFDSCTNFKDYIKLAKRDGDTAIAFSNHGGIYDWVKKKQECDKAGIKYIHGAEFYMCDKLTDNDRGYHIGLYSKNWEGVKELNTLISKSKSKGVKDDNSDRHSYINPRISLDELMNTSDNIIVTTACVASMLFQYKNSSNKMIRVKNGEELKFSQAELNRIKISKIESMSEEDFELYSKMKKKDRDALVDKMKPNYDKLSEYYLETVDKMLNWMSENNHRTFLEVQYHKFEKQQSYNKMILEWSEKYGVPIIAGSDTHSSSKYKAECRKIVQISKDSYYGDEDSADLTWCSYDEFFDRFKQQGVLTEDQIKKAIKNTTVFADMVDDFDLDYEFKYPTLYGDNANQILRDLVEDKFKYKLDNNIIDSNNRDLYREKIEEEFETFTKQGMESFMIFMSELLTWCDENNIPHGDRGSVTGSTIAYIIDITDTDPVVWKTVFSRFCNIHRISLGDIDCDFAPEDRVKVYEYIINRFTPEKTAYILTLGTLKDRGTIDVLSKGLNSGENDLELVKTIKNKFDDFHGKYQKIIQEEVNLEDLEGDESEASNIDFSHHDIYMRKIRVEKKAEELDAIKDKWDTLKEENKDLFYYFDGIKGTIVSKGNHAAGMIGSPITLYDNLGVHYKDGKESFPISSCSMKAVDSLNYVKFDILGLKTLGIIKDAYEYMGVKWKKSHEMNWSDDKVWDNMITNRVGVFQFEGEYSFSLLKDFKPNTITHMSMVNAGLRPSGKSYRDKLIAREVNKNPSKEIDELLADNNGWLIFQEDTIKFLTDICGFDGGTADVIRRAIGKKDKKTLNEYMPKILDGYCNHSSQPREVAEKEAEQFLQIISDSSEYQFGFNHSTFYSMNGYRCVDIRTYNPIVFTTSYLNRAMNDDDILNGTELAKSYGYKIEPIKFRKSFSKYNYDEREGIIYKGTGSIKGMGKTSGDELYELRDNQYDSFTSLLYDIYNNTSVNNGKISILIELDYFSEFGSSKKLAYIADTFHTWHNKKTAKFYNKSKGEKVELEFDESILRKYSEKRTDCQFSGVDFVSVIRECEKNTEDATYTIKEKVEFQMKHLGYINLIDDTLSKRIVIVTSLDTRYSPKADLYCINTGATLNMKFNKLTKKDGGKKRRQRGIVYFEDREFKTKDILYLDEVKKKPRVKYEDGDWIELEEEDFWVNRYRIIE